jgi:hypothetical protein
MIKIAGNMFKMKRGQMRIVAKSTRKAYNIPYPSDIAVKINGQPRKVTNDKLLLNEFQGVE